MLPNDYHIHDIYQYTRKSYKQNKSPRDNVFENPLDTEPADPAENSRDIGTFEVVEDLPRSSEYVVSGCQYDQDPDGDLASILHKKCPVISLAQQQLLRLLDETNRLVRTPNTNCSLLICCLYHCKYILREHRSQCVLVGFIFVAFLAGLLLGAASCGTHFGKFNSPILNCIDNYFVPDDYVSIEDTFRCIT